MLTSAEYDHTSRELRAAPSLSALKSARMLFSLLAVAVVLAGALSLLLTSFVDQADASTAVAEMPTAVTASGTVSRPRGAGCSERAWPYYEAECLQNTAQRGGNRGPIRVIPIVSPVASR